MIVRSMALGASLSASPAPDWLIDFSYITKIPSRTVDILSCIAHIFAVLFLHGYHIISTIKTGLRLQGGVCGCRLFELTVPPPIFQSVLLPNAIWRFPNTVFSVHDVKEIRTILTYTANVVDVLLLFLLMSHFYREF